MRMHTHGKCTSNILLGALTVFCVVLLYNYWTVSSLNHDLILKIHSLEARIIQVSGTNDALQATLDKVQDIKEKVEGNLRKEQLVDQKAKEEIAQKSNKIKSLLNDVENSKQATQNCRDELTQAEAKMQDKDKEVSEIKAKIVSLEAQLVEKSNKVSRLEKEVRQKLVGGSSSSTAKSGGDKGPVPAPAIEVAHQDDQEQPVLINDPAENEMKPEVGGASPIRQPDSLVKPQMQDDGNINNNGGGEDFGPQPAVLPVPGHRAEQPVHAEQNLDAAEDDGDRPMKDDFGVQDDQSPDGALSQKEVINAAIQAPNMKHDDVDHHQ